jgi:hypothetical protein
MSVEEYLRIMDLDREAERRAARAVKPKPPTKRGKRVGKKDPKMARALKKANAMGRKKAGGFKKGWSQGEIMRKAHQLRRKM